MSNDRKPSGRRPPPIPSGFDARDLAVRMIQAVLGRGRSLEDALDHAAGAALEPRDRGLARLIAATVLRRLGQIETVLAAFIDKPLPEQRGILTPILLSAGAQLLFLGTPPHAAINIAVEQCRLDRGARRFDKLANAVLRRVAEKGPAMVAAQDAAALNVPEWMLARWTAAYGAATAKRIAEASLEEAALDLTLKAGLADPPETWAGRLKGRLLETGSIRLIPDGSITALPGFNDGAWWVQDTAASLPHRLLGPVKGRKVADLCAAPGGKTAALAAAGADVTAVDISTTRLARVRENLDRLGLSATLVESDIVSWQPGAPMAPRDVFDAVLLDAPCTATGTIRRHPDILRLKRPEDMTKLAAHQQRLLDSAAGLVKPGGTLVFCTCSLEVEEGPAQVDAFLARPAGQAFARRPLTAGEHGLDAQWISAAGDLRTFPFHLPAATPRESGMDGFYASRLQRKP